MPIMKSRKRVTKWVQNLGLTQCQDSEQVTNNICLIFTPIFLMQETAIMVVHPYFSNTQP